MIVSATPDSLVQRAADGEQRTVAFSDLVAGVVETGDGDASIGEDPNVIALPEWPAGTREFLFRTEVPSSPGAHGHEHRRLVNAVHARLVALGNVAEGLADFFASEPARPAEDAVELPYTIPDDVIAAIEASKGRG